MVYFEECALCGDYADQNLIVDIPLCYSCYQKQVKRFKKINPSALDFHKSYSSKFKLSKEKTKEYFGVELEFPDLKNGEIEYDEGFKRPIPFLNSLKKVIAHNNKFFHYKKDCSISECGYEGIEVVSNPFTWEWLQKNKDVFKTMFSFMKRKGYKITDEIDSCGMHVHFSKTSISHEIFDRMWFMIEDNQEKIFEISGRNDPDAIAQYCSFECPFDADEKYCALNEVNLATYEMRIFNSPKNFEEFMKNMQFVKSLIEFCRTNTRLSWNLYKKYVQANKESYPELHKFMSKMAETD